MAKFLNVGKGALVNIDKIRCIISGDADKVRKVMLKHGYDRSSVEVYDVTADAETRSVLVLSDETMIISSVSANALNKRIHEDYDKQQFRLLTWIFVRKIKHIRGFVKILVDENPYKCILLH